MGHMNLFLGSKSFNTIYFMIRACLSLGQLVDSSAGVGYSGNIASSTYQSLVVLGQMSLVVVLVEAPARSQLVNQLVFSR